MSEEITVDLLYEMIMTCQRVIRNEILPEHVQTSQILEELLETQPSEKTILHRLTLLNYISDILLIKIMRWRQRLSGYTGVARDLSAEELARALVITPVLQIDVFSNMSLLLSFQDRMDRNLPTIEVNPSRVPQFKEITPVMDHTQDEVLKMLAKGIDPFDGEDWTTAVKRSIAFHELIKNGKIKIKSLMNTTEIR